MKKSESISKLSMALSKAQAEMPVVKMNSQNPFLKNKYADLGAVIETSRLVLAKYELAVTQFPTSDGDKIGVTTCLAHSSGEWIEGTIFINSTDSKGLSVAQSAGVVISYLRRYAWASVLGLYADEDTDGHENSEPTKKPAQKPEGKPSPSNEHQELIKAFSASFNAVPQEMKGKTVTITGKSTDEEIRKATEHNLNLMKVGA